MGSRQVRFLAEGVVTPMPFADDPPIDVLPTRPFSVEVICCRLPPPGGFGQADLRCCRVQGPAR